MIQHRRFCEESGGVYHKEDWCADHEGIMSASQADLYAGSSGWIRSFVEYSTLRSLQINQQFSAGRQRFDVHFDGKKQYFLF